jgi:hypothetical protein
LTNSPPSDTTWSHDGAEVGGRTYGGEPGHAGTGDEDLGRRDLAGSGDLAIEESAEGVGRLDHGTVAADAGHRGQRVHLLRARQLARQRVDGQHGGLALGELLHQFRVLGRPDEADERGALADEWQLFDQRGPHLEDDVGACPQRRCIRCDLRAGRPVGLVIEVGGVAGTPLDHHGEAQLHKLHDDLGYRGNPLLAGKYFPRHSDDQGHGNLG